MQGARRAGTGVYAVYMRAKLEVQSVLRTPCQTQPVSLASETVGAPRNTADGHRSSFTTPC